MIIIDCSAMMSVLMEDENNNACQILFKKLSCYEEEATVPCLFFAECNNVLLNSLHQKRILQSQWHKLTQALSNLPFDVDIEGLTAKKVVFLSEISKKYDLTVYDAIYLELAIRKNLLLATLDKQLQSAAFKLKLNYFD